MISMAGSWLCDDVVPGSTGVVPGCVHHFPITQLLQRSPRRVHPAPRTAGVWTDTSGEHLSMGGEWV